MSKSVVIREYVLGCLDDIIETLNKQPLSDPEAMSLVDLNCVRGTLDEELEKIKEEILTEGKA